MNTTTHIGALAAFIFLGVFQGLVLSIFFVLKSRSNIRANIYQGLLIFALSLGILEQLLNLTGYAAIILTGHILMLMKLFLKILSELEKYVTY